MGSSCSRIFVSSAKAAWRLRSPSTKARSPGCTPFFVPMAIATGTAKIALNPSADKLEGSGAVPKETDAVVSLRLANGKSSQARFELGGHKH